MKFLKPQLWLVVLLMVFTACDNDDDNSNSVELTIENLAGTYNITFLENSTENTQIASNGEEVVIETQDCIGDTFTNVQFTFNIDGTATFSGSFREVCLTTINGNVTEDSEIVDLEDMGPFSVNSTNNTIIFNGLSADVTLFNGTDLQLEIIDIDTFEDETETFTSEIRMVREY